MFANLFDDCSINAGMIKYIYPFLKMKHAYVPHGFSVFTKLPALSVHNFGNPDVTLVSSELEKEYFKSDLGYKNVRVLGYPKHDKWKVGQYSGVMLAFTWRKEESDKIDLYFEMIEKTVKQLSDQITCYVFHHALIEEFRNRIIEIVSSINPNIKFVNITDTKEFEDAINKNKILVTDISSLAYDFMYHGKTSVSIIDKNYLSCTYALRDVYFTHSPAVIVDDIDNLRDVIDNTSGVTKNIFKYNDDCNCERVYQQLEEI